jgi:hypothetical protein
MENFNVLESNWMVLMQKLMKFAENVDYYNLQNIKDGHFAQLFKNELLIILIEIFLFDNDTCRKSFINASNDKSKDHIRDDLKKFVEDKIERLLKYENISSSDLSNIAAKIRECLQSTLQLTPNSHYGTFGFFKMLGAIKQINEKYSEYIDKIENSGFVEPAISLTIAFLKNYSTVVNVFNQRFKELPNFYLSKIVGAVKRDVLPAKILVAPIDNAGINLLKVKSVFLQRSDEISNDNHSHIISIYKKDVPLKDNECSCNMFHSDISFYDPIGFIVESPILILREGKRIINLQFKTDKENYSRQDTEIGEDSFGAEISCESGWLHAASCSTRLNNVEGVLEMAITFTEDMPTSSLCNEELHGIATIFPALRISLNKDAKLFAYDVVSNITFSELTLKVHSEGITSLKLYNEYGELDATVPFYPFGVQAKKGSSFVFGNYEISQKPVTKVIFNCRWLQLPEDERGFEGHYALYSSGYKINNRSFKVKTEWLNDRQWTDTESKQLLFKSNADAVKPEDNSSLEFVQNASAAQFSEEMFALGKVSNGFFRVSLIEPEIGFGGELYRQLFSEIMVRNARKKIPSPLPKEPITPMMTDVCLDYEAEVNFNTDEQISETDDKFPIRFYKLESLGFIRSSHSNKIGNIHLLPSIENDANLFFAFENALGVDKIRLFFNLSMKNGYDDYNCDEQPHVEWYINNGIDWSQITPESVLQDTTEGITSSGLVELHLPDNVKKDWIDNKNLFWLKASIKGDYLQCRQINGVYLNAFEIEVNDTNNIPPEGMQFIMKSFEGRNKEDENSLSNRFSNQVSHRNRALLPLDFERMVLENFTTIEKVKCLTATESFDKQVRIVIMGREENYIYPLCSLTTLKAVENMLLPLISPFAQLKITNPFYEQVIVNCRLHLSDISPENEVITRLTRKINHYIAPWLFKKEMPNLNRGISMKGLFTILINDSGIENIFSLSLSLKDSIINYSISEKEDMIVKELHTWGVFVPSDKHLIYNDTSNVHEKPAEGINYWVLGNNFIIN